MAVKELTKNAAPVTFGLVIILGFFHVLQLLFTVNFPSENKDLITSLSKTLENILIMAVSYWFGTNAGSKAKDETIGSIAQSSSPPPPTSIAQTTEKELPTTLTKKD